MNTKQNKSIPMQVYVCPMCRGDRWLGLGAREVSEFIIPAPIVLSEIDKDGDAPRHAVVAIACSGCGFVRLHSLDALEK